MSPRSTACQAVAPGGTQPSSYVQVAGGQPARRAGYTLLELLLVLGLLVLIAALVIPSAGRLLSSQSLRSGAEMVRAEWAKARVKAMKSGRIHVFRYEIGGPTFSTEFWEADDTAVEGGNEDALELGDGDSPFYAAETQELPEGVQFFFGEAETDLRSAAVEEELEPAAERGVAWSPPILFYSDGTCSNAEVTLMNDNGRMITLRLRGLTGVVKVGDVTRTADGGDLGTADGR